MAGPPHLHVPAPRTVPPRGGDGPALNAEQAAAVAHGDGPLLIVAGAGTGKTRTLIHRVAALVERGTPPGRILLLTFTRRTAQEMLARAERLVGSAAREVQGGTFHATAHRLLRRFGPAAGLAADFTILDQADAIDLMQLARAAVGAGARGTRFAKPETLHQVYSRHVNTDLPVEAILAAEVPQFRDDAAEIGQVFADYTRRKAERNLVDYDDLLLFWAALLAAPTLGAQVAGLYDHVLVDEYQDTNRLQARILRGLCRTHANLTVVGDDAQSIYAFRGATVRNILDFPAEYPGTRVVTLERNYRSSQPILDTSNRVMAQATERFTKALWTTRTDGEAPWLVTCPDEPAQTRFVVERILQLHEDGVPLREIAVLFRAGYQSADLEIELTARNLPFEKWGGLKFLEAAHVKDVLAFLRILENPRDEVSWFRVLRLLPGIGEASARAAMTLLAEAAWATEAFERYRPPPRAREAHAALARLLGALRGGATGTDVAEEIARVRELYDGLLRDRYDKAEPRLADLDQLQTIAAGYPDRGTFLAALALEPPASTQDLAGGADGEDDVLVLSTAHSAKGREWDAVFVLWAVDGSFPLARALGDPAQVDEERRLLYVALTRARHHLAVTYPLQDYATRRGAEWSLDQVSRFLDADVRATMQRVVVEAARAADPATPPAGAGEIDLRALLRGRFGA
jgi:DNA helicase-2/ATP-dependent DNA helicase PcrA